MPVELPPIVPDSGSIAWSGLHCTDEDVSILLSGDFAALVPVHQRLAEGTDGVISGRVLTSASVDFEAAGIGVGHVVAVPGTGAHVALDRNLPVSTFALWGVAGVSGHSVTLRPPGHDAGTGSDPPAVASGASFFVPTARPQIGEVTGRHAERFAASVIAAKPTLFAEMAAVGTARELYAALNKSTTGGGTAGSDNYGYKFTLYDKWYAGLIDRATAAGLTIEAQAAASGGRLRVGRQAVPDTLRIPGAY